MGELSQADTTLGASIADEVRLLKRIPLFAGIDTKKLKLLAFTSERQRFEPGDLLVREGEVGTSAFIIIDGEADVLIETAHGPLCVSEVRRYGIVGDIAILCDVRRTATVRARTKVDALCITKDLFFSLVHEFPEMGIEIMRVLARRVDRMTRLVRDTVDRHDVEAAAGSDHAAAPDAGDGAPTPGAH